MYGLVFHEMHARLRGPKSLLNLFQIMNRTGFPKKPNHAHKLNIKVAAFTVSEECINVIILFFRTANI